MYVKRDGEGEILLVSRELTPQCDEYLAADSRELLDFMFEQESRNDLAHFQASDLAFVRVLEDVIELLMDKGVIRFTELPEAAQQKVMERQSMRHRLNGLHLVADQDEDDGVI
ncbi:tryptophan synthase subunit beta like protein [Halomonas sp. SL1]|uniref:tryptophan synthase subunit beta like protein n=1 Tax=Halomonas sp. SL1 TaxID=2137478 RepID=UPI000D17C755|nr:tryptophan synthase subunit beta like protein [Halomonas sp. SL1]RAH38156.1 tryptophan synthase subunit beta like protein [Halomonas sp. SL1]